MTEKLTIQMAYHLWAEATSSDWNWAEDERVENQLRCYKCGRPSLDHNKSIFQAHHYEPGVLVTTNLMGSDLPPRKPGNIALEDIEVRADELHNEFCRKDCERHIGQTWQNWAEMELEDEIIGKPPITVPRGIAREDEEGTTSITPVAIPPSTVTVDVGIAEDQDARWLNESWLGWQWRLYWKQRLK